MVYELRTYWSPPGKLEALNDRFRNLTLRLFDRHNMVVVGFWTPDPRTEETGDLVYILKFMSVEALNSSWDAFRQDPEWQEGKAASERDGPLVSKITSQVLLPTDYSPLK